MSFNNLGTKGIHKLAAAAAFCVLLKSLNVAGNKIPSFVFVIFLFLIGNNFNASDINILLSKLEDHQSLKELNISHNHLDEEGGIYVAKWLSKSHSIRYHFQTFDYLQVIIMF